LVRTIVHKHRCDIGVDDNDARVIPEKRSDRWAIVSKERAPSRGPDSDMPKGSPRAISDSSQPATAVRRTPAPRHDELAVLDDHEPTSGRAKDRLDEVRHESTSKR